MAELFEEGSSPVHRGKALVVDDELTSRVLLQAQLEREHYEVATAADGASAVEQYAIGQPDIVFLDVMLPDQYGYAVARQIKKMAGEKFVPIIFLTGLKEEEALAESVEAGGDDFLTKPFSFSVLKSKIAAIERIRDLYERVRIQNSELNRLHTRMRYEQEIAERVLSGAVMAANVAQPPMQSLLRAASTFNGDVLLSAHTPSGGLCVLLGDFTGHGLAAAIGALPVSETFRSMTASGFALDEVMAEINRKLHRLLPTGMFLATAALRIEPDLRAAVVWNSGLPDMYLCRQTGEVRKFSSQHPPMGALAEILPGSAPVLIEVMPGDAFVLCSDGVTEACNPAGEMFGDDRFKHELTSNAPDRIFSALGGALETFMGDAEQIDDVSLVVVPCCAGLFPVSAVDDCRGMPSVAGGSDWHWSLTLTGLNLARVDPLPLAMKQLQAFGVPSRHCQNLFVVITEMFSNALEHGVLGLNSMSKVGAEGFLHYYGLRQQAIEALHGGQVQLDLQYRAGASGEPGVLQIMMTDSGLGFDHAAMMAARPEDEERLYGRGIRLLRSLCQRVSYSGAGNRVEVQYQM